jgi:hypothetical protein
MSRFRISPPLAALGLFGIAAVGFGIWFAVQKAPSKLEIGTETTVVTTPLDERGRIDYETPLNDELSRGIRPETNAMVAFTRVLGPRPEGGTMHPDWWKRLGTQEPLLDGDYLMADAEKFLADHMPQDMGFVSNHRQALMDEENRLRNEPWVSADSPHYVEWLKANDKPLSLAAEAAKLPHYFHPLIARDKDGTKKDLYYCLLPYCQRMRVIASMLSIRAMWHLGEGRMDAAWADVMTIHRLGGLMIQNPGTLIEYLVGVAIRTIALHKMVKVVEVAKPDLDQLTRWKNEFQSKPVAPNWEKVIGVTERYCGLDAFFGLKHDMDRPVINDQHPVLEKKTVELLRRNRAKIDWNEVMKSWNKSIDEVVLYANAMTRLNSTTEQRATAKKQFAELLASIEPLDTDDASQRVMRSIVKLQIPGTEKIIQQSLRLQQHTSFVDLMFQIEEHRLKHGNYPESIGQFDPPQDFFAGGSITYRKLPNGFYLHSVGQNKKDDFNENIEEQFHGDDVVVKMLRK